LLWVVARGKDPQRGLGWAIRRVRFEADLTQSALARRVKVHPSQISRLEKGTDNPRWGTVRRVAAGLGVSVAELAAVAEDFEERRQ
jgi:transcriptional regulator with XRE-family HTH domain